MLTTHRLLGTWRDGVDAYITPTRFAREKFIEGGLPGEKIIVSIPIVLHGIPEGVRLGGGILDQVLRELEIEVDPASIPNHIDADVTHLTVGHSLHVRDLGIPAGVTVLVDEEAPVALVQISRAGVEAEATPAEGDAAAPAEPELIRKTKDEEEGEGEK